MEYKPSVALEELRKSYDQVSRSLNAALEAEIVNVCITVLPSSREEGSTEPSHPDLARLLNLFEELVMFDKAPLLMVTRALHGAIKEMFSQKSLSARERQCHVDLLYSLVRELEQVAFWTVGGHRERIISILKNLVGAGVLMAKDFDCRSFVRSSLREAEESIDRLSTIANKSDS
jgi:hypothetical protein